jgi:hypothetical protein
MVDRVSRTISSIFSTSFFNRTVPRCGDVDVHRLPLEAAGGFVAVCPGGLCAAAVYQCGSHIVSAFRASSPVL